MTEEQPFPPIKLPPYVLRNGATMVYRYCGLGGDSSQHALEQLARDIDTALVAERNEAKAEVAALCARIETLQAKLTSLLSNPSPTEYA